MKMSITFLHKSNEQVEFNIKDALPFIVTPSKREILVRSMELLIESPETDPHNIVN